MRLHREQQTDELLARPPLESLLLLDKLERFPSRRLSITYLACRLESTSGSVFTIADAAATTCHVLHQAHRRLGFVELTDRKKTLGVSQGLNRKNHLSMMPGVAQGVIGSTPKPCLQHTAPFA
jgi:hypothetical protein